MSNIIEFRDIDALELAPYARLTEAELYHFHEPHEGLFIAESPNVILRALDAGYAPVSFLMEKKHITGAAKELLARCPDVPVYTAPLSELTSLTGFPLTRGVLCAMNRVVLPEVSELLKDAHRIAILENVMNPTNIGAIFRSAAALGMDAVILTRGSSDPLYRRAARVSMGTVFQIPWTFFDKKMTWPEEGAALLRSHGFKTVAMALTDNSISIDDPVLQKEDRLAVILGTEGDGLSNTTIDDCDYTVKIPMYHDVDSLNVAAASAVAFYALNQRK